MANLDTREKRASAINVGLPWRGLLPLPDGTIGQADRQQLATLYAGILATTAVDATFTWPVAITLQDPPAITLQARPLVTLQDLPSFTLE